jgi:hypothetical protein
MIVHQQQQITVRHQHVTVNADQAIVGNVTAGGGSEQQSKEQRHAIAYAPGITVPSTGQIAIRVDLRGSASNGI